MITDKVQELNIIQPIWLESEKFELKTGPKGQSYKLKKLESNYIFYFHDAAEIEDCIEILKAALKRLKP